MQNQKYNGRKRKTKNRVLKLKNKKGKKKHCIKISTLIDDIYTTGSTIETMSKILKSYGIEKIYFITIASVDNL